jgi:hypothetical protein
MRIVGVVALVLALTAAVHGQGSKSGSVGTVRIPQAVIADGGTLKPGTYEVRLSGGGDAPTIEFLQKGQVVGTTLGIVPPEKQKLPAGAHAARVKDNNPYVRITISRGGQQYLAYLPAAR